MNVQNLLIGEMKELRRRNPDVHALLEKIFQHKDGKGDYSIERYKWRETPNKEAFLNEVRQLATDKETE